MELLKTTTVGKTVAAQKGGGRETCDGGQGARRAVEADGARRGRGGVVVSLELNREIGFFPVPPTCVPLPSLPLVRFSRRRAATTRRPHQMITAVAQHQQLLWRLSCAPRLTIKLVRRRRRHDTFASYSVAICLGRSQQF